MTQEQKAKAYDEAIRKIKGMMPNWERLSYNGKTFLQDIVSIFPELTENEDEKIREKIIALVNAHGQGMFKESMLDWLEKQGDIRKKIKAEIYGDIMERMRKVRAKADIIPDYDINIQMKTPEESLGISSGEYNKIVDDCIFGEDKKDGEDEKIRKGMSSNMIRKDLVRQFEKVFREFKKKYPDWEKRFPNDLHYRLMGWYDDWQHYFDIDGYSEKARDFASYVWDKYVDPPEPQGGDKRVSRNEVCRWLAENLDRYDPSIGWDKEEFVENFRKFTEYL